MSHAARALPAKGARVHSQKAREGRGEDGREGRERKRSEGLFEKGDARIVSRTEKREERLSARGEA